MDEELNKKIEHLVALTEQNHAMLKSIKRHFIWQRVVGIFYFVIIVGPIIWSVVYLPKIIQPMLAQYQDLLGVSNANGQIDLQSIQKVLTPELLKNLQQGK